MHCHISLEQQIGRVFLTKKYEVGFSLVLNKAWTAWWCGVLKTLDCRSLMGILPGILYNFLFNRGFWDRLLQFLSPACMQGISGIMSKSHCPVLCCWYISECTICYCFSLLQSLTDNFICHHWSQEYGLEILAVIKTKYSHFCQMSGIFSNLSLFVHTNPPSH